MLYAVVGAHDWAHAQDAQHDGESTARSQKLFAAALEAKRARDLPRALCLMQRAQLAWSNPAFSFNVAQLQRELGMCSEAQQNYQAFLEHESEPARREQAQVGLAELAQCKPTQLPRDAAASSCTAWAEMALHAGARPNTVPTPAEVARAQSSQISPALASSQPARRSKRILPAYLPWVFAGVGVVCVGFAGYELSQISAAERGLESDGAMGAAAPKLEQDGYQAQTLFWVFGGAGSLALAGALVLALVDTDE